MAQQTINFGTPPAGTDGDTTVEALRKHEANFTELYGQLGQITAPPGYIDGLKMVWVSGTALTLTSGAAYIEGTGEVLFSDSDIAKTGLSLTASAWYHAYVYDNAGTPDFVLSTTAPATAYNGTARSMTGDSSKRYAGSVLTDGSGLIYNFFQQGSKIKYLAGILLAPFNVLATGTATSPTSISCAGIVPVTARVMQSVASNTDATQLISLTTSDSGYTLSSTLWSGLIANASASTMDIILDASQAFIYMFQATPSGGHCTIRVNGYEYER